MEVITTEQMKQIERLAMLALSEEKREEMAQALTRLIEYADTLKQVDTEGVLPAVHLFQGINVLREDEPGEVYRVEAITANAPLQKDGVFVVPKTIAGQEG